VIIDIIKKKARISGFREVEYMDDTVFLETCAIKNIISYPQFISLNQVFQLYEDATQRRIIPGKLYPESAV
jgi:hypothetical protein